MNILAIESSCDETAAAIISGDPFSTEKSHHESTESAHKSAVQTNHPTPVLLSNVVVSQIDIFKAYGGVIPEVAARSHLEAILPVIHQAFRDASLQKGQEDDWSQIDAIAVTHTPGLLGSLLIGTLTARVLAILHDKPLYAVHHLKSHIYANWLGAPDTTPDFPLLSLVVSGGHTQIIRMTKHNQFEIIGTTLDDAVGECFDKVAKILGLPYPGGPAIAKAANGEVKIAENSTSTDKNYSTAQSAQIQRVTPGDPHKYPLPHPNIKGLDFSFSGLKTAVLRSVQKAADVPISAPSHELKNLLSPQQKADFAASFQETACDILIEKLQRALDLYPDTRAIVVAGGVSANARLREKTISAFNSNVSAPVVMDTDTQIYHTNKLAAINTSVFFPEPRFSGDNAAMVGAAAFYEIASKVAPTDPYKLNILPRSAIN